MSFDIVVVAVRERVPKPSAWQSAIERAGFPMELDTEFDVETFSGYLPCRFRGNEAGFDYVSQIEAVSVTNGTPSGRDFTAILSAHDESLDAATAVVAAAVLCAESEGILTDPQSGESIPASASIEWARRRLADLESSANNSTSGAPSTTDKPSAQVFGLRLEVARLIGKRITHVLVIGALSTAVFNARLLRGAMFWTFAALLLPGFAICLVRVYRAVRMPYELTLEGNGELAWASAFRRGALQVSGLLRIAPSRWDHGTADVYGTGENLQLPIAFAAQRDLWTALRSVQPGLRIDVP